MKRYILVFCCMFFLISLIIYGQTTTTPVNVTNAFNLKYPTAQNVQWSSQGKNFKAIFLADGFNYETMYNINGNWLVTQRTISFNELPTVVKTSLSGGKFSNWKINDVFILFYPGMITKYSIHISKDGNSKNLLMSWDGKLLDDNF